MKQAIKYKKKENTVSISIIMPAFNVAEYVNLAVESVINQTYKDWELIICDDNSSDETLAVIKKISAFDNRIIAITNSFDKGAPGARNSAIELAAGKYIAFLDADDFWLPEKLQKQIECLEETNAAMVHSDYYLMTEAGERSDVAINTPNLITRRKMMFANFLPCLTVIYDSDKLGKYYQPNIERRNDYALWLEMFSKRKDLTSVRCNGVLAAYRVNSYGLSSNSFLSLRFHWLALVNFGRYNQLIAIVFSLIFLLIVLTKKKFLNIYNVLVRKI